jgi:Kef-type K+ transport system membrane component KefB
MAMVRSAAPPGGEADGEGEPAEPPARGGWLPAGGRSPLRLGATYSLLVIVPVVAIVAFLSLAGGPSRPGPLRAGAAPAADLFPRVLLAVVAIVAACALVGALFRWLGQPAVVGEILTGILLGPSVLGAVWPAATARLFPAGIMPQLDALAQLGVILFVFVAGLEVNTRALRGRGDVAVVVSHVSIAVPFLLGVVLALLAYGTFAPGGVEFIPFALFLGASMSVTALPVLARILMEKGMYRSDVGTVAITCALVSDVTAWCLLATAVALTRSATLAGVLVTIALTAGFAVLMVLGLRPALRLAGRERLAGRPDLLLPLVLLGLLAAALATDRIGVHAIFGAFVFGLACPRDLAVFRAVREKVGDLTTALLLPLFFTYSGLRTDIGLLGLNLGRWLWCGLILVVAVAGKLAASAVAARAVGVGWPTSLQLGALLNARGLTELIVLNVGLDLGVLNRTLFTMLVIMALVSTAMTAPILTAVQRRIDRSAAPPAAIGAAGLPPARDGSW